VKNARGALLALLLAAGRAAAECPACAGAASAEQRSVWPIVGAFMLVPPLLAAIVILLMRREFRTSFGPKTAGPAAEILSFSRGRKTRPA
jgi:hypothetical protein